MHAWEGRGSGKEQKVKYQFPSFNFTFFLILHFNSYQIKLKNNG
jgi:hypothetical protein